MKPLNIGCLSSGKHATKNIIPMIINHEEFNLVLVHARDLNKLKDSLITARIFEESSDDFDLNKIDLKFYEFEHKLYQQRGSMFLSNLSVLDILLNLGPSAKLYLNKNFKLKNY